VAHFADIKTTDLFNCRHFGGFESRLCRVEHLLTLLVSARPLMYQMRYNNAEWVPMML
jgi:hypothetical protein